MATAYKARSNVPPESQSIVDRLELLGFTWQYIPEQTIADESVRVQIRDSEAVAPRNEVAKYRESLRRGDKMPAIIMTRDGVLVDGATRTKAARSLGKQTYPAFRLDVTYDGAPEAVIRNLKILGAAFNLTHGRGMSTKNIEAVILAVADEDDRPSDIAKKLHVPTSTVNGALAMSRARNRAERLGVDISDETRVSVSVLKILGQRSKFYNEEPYRELARLTRDARLTVADINAVSHRLEVLETDAEKLAAIQHERASRVDVIKGVASVPNRAARLRQSLGYLLKNADNPGLLVESRPELSEMHMEQLWLAVGALKKVIAEQEHVR